jgi:hypothetical protein
VGSDRRRAFEHQNRTVLLAKKGNSSKQNIQNGLGNTNGSLIGGGGSQLRRAGQDCVRVHCRMSGVRSR